MEDDIDLQTYNLKLFILIINTVCTVVCYMMTYSHTYTCCVYMSCMYSLVYFSLSLFLFLPGTKTQTAQRYEIDPIPLPVSTQPFLGTDFSEGHISSIF